MAHTIKQLLSDGTSIPVFGLGLFQAQLNGETEQACLLAFKHGYRMIDTATLYKSVNFSFAKGKLRVKHSSSKNLETKMK